MASKASILAAAILSLGMIGFAAVAAGKKRRNRTSCASTATMLGVVILSQAMASGWSTACLIFCRVIAFAAVAAGTRDSESSSKSTSRNNYEVFLSFRGADTRKGFTDHLYSKLIDMGIYVFRDDEELRGGEKIKPQLEEAIKRSKISIVVFSKDYASSRSCLMEAVLMWECQIFNGQTIIPIFYDISPDDVKRQAGDFGRSFRRHKKDRVEADDIQKWKEVLGKIGRLRGFNREEINGGHESQLVKEVVRRVSQVLKKKDRVVPDKLVGIDLHVHEVMRKLGRVYTDRQDEDICAVGICGMPGVGKTTLAKVVYNKIHMSFDNCSFLESINSKRVMDSQKKLIADLKEEKSAELESSDDGIQKIECLSKKKKVLIVLDDVNEVQQIKALAGKLSWFGPGSRIIMTTRRRDLLYGFDDGAAQEYKVEPMRDYHALQLFRKHAFRGNAPQDASEYDSLSINIAKTIGGLPLTIEVIASYLHLKRKDIEIWRSTLESLKKHQENKVDAVFMASYESLDVPEREIFLDIACFFIGKDKRIPSYMWEACGYYPAINIERLRDMHLLEDGKNNELRMHDLLRDFGRKLADSKVLHERCRLWNSSDALSFLKDGKGTENVKGTGLTSEEFCKMSNLRYLSLAGAHFRGNIENLPPNLWYLGLDRARIQGNIENLPPNLRWLEWRECNSIPELGNMDLKELLILDLSRSRIELSPKFWEQITKKVEKLKVLNLQGCFYLVGRLQLPGLINLEMLILEGCRLLQGIGPFIRNLKKLSCLNLRNCHLIRELPRELCCIKSLTELLIDGSGIERINFHEGSLENLKILSARNCIYLRYISTLGSLRNLSNLALDGAKIDGLPDTFEFPPKLQTLSLRGCRDFRKIPTSIGKLQLLEVMDLSNIVIRQLPESVKDLSNLKMLKMSHTFLRIFPESIVNSKTLEEIDFSGCRNMGQVPCNISGLSSLRILRLSLTDVAGLPQSICGLSCLQTLDILYCDHLQALPKLPSSLLSLRWGSNGMTVPDLSNLTNLKELVLRDEAHEPPRWGLLNLKTLKTPWTPDIGWITRLTSLETLELSLPYITNLPRNFSALTQLRELSLSYMEKLDLTQLPSSSSLWTLRLQFCKILKPKFSGLKYLSELQLEDCDLAEIDGREDLTLLKGLHIFRCNGITNLNGLKDLPRLPSLPELSEHVQNISVWEKILDMSHVPAEQIRREMFQRAKQEGRW